MPFTYSCPEQRFILLKRTLIRRNKITLDCRHVPIVPRKEKNNQMDDIIYYTSYMANLMELNRAMDVGTDIVPSHS